jgi:hypothetical protein
MRKLHRHLLGEMTDTKFFTTGLGRYHAPVKSFCALMTVLLVAG